MELRYDIVKQIKRNQLRANYSKEKKNYNLITCLFAIKTTQRIYITIQLLIYNPKKTMQNVINQHFEDTTIQIFVQNIHTMHQILSKTSVTRLRKLRIAIAKNCEKYNISIAIAIAKLMNSLQQKQQQKSL
eukprot:TRINITY_DN9454_c0_g2_i1.p2 TRINITY_DN9454_c0_g2~~TRINITY_DN9454_c0_g2_i1.p2  ORF type:complete len:131 (-),score=7.90 TRINITY_DN9454_c0_g2_i1:482-874(-)